MSQTIIFNKQDIIKSLKEDFRKLQMDYLNIIKDRPDKKSLEIIILIELLNFYENNKNE